MDEPGKKNPVYIIGVTNNMGPVENLREDYERFVRERRLFGYWKDYYGNEWHDLQIAKNNISIEEAKELLITYKQVAGLALYPDGSYELVGVLPTGSDDPRNEEIEMDFNRYWKECINKRLTISEIVWATRYGAKISDLPQDVQEKVRSAMHARKRGKIAEPPKYRG